MAESLVLFESVINSRWFLRTSIILFMNKIDLFAAKLPKVPLERFFSDYAGMFSFMFLAKDASNLSDLFSRPLILGLTSPILHLLGGSDISKAAKYILWRFTQTNRARLHIYPQYVGRKLRQE
jgi:guanine nucleotide-binding protein subunit alpha